MTDREEAWKKLIEQHEKMFQNSTLKERQAAAEFLEHFARCCQHDDLGRD